MKNIFKLIFVVGISFSLFSCEEKVELYNADRDSLKFNYEYLGKLQSDSVENYTFTFEAGDVIEHELMVDVYTVGNIKDYDREFTFEQVECNTIDDKEVKAAVAGVHYVAFDDERYDGKFVIKAGENHASVPVIILRDASLASDAYILKIKVKESDTFETTYEKCRYKTISMADIFTKPAHWVTNTDVYFGNGYGIEKHKFMNTVCLENFGVPADDTFFESVFPDPAPGSYWAKYDMGYINYLAALLIRELQEYNLERIQNGQGLLKEKLEEGQLEATLVQFCLYISYPATPQPVLPEGYNAEDYIDRV